MIHAFVHTQGVFFNQIYYPLELAYVDVLGDEAHFILTSPLSFHETKRSYPHARPDAIMTTGGGVSYSVACRFLHERRNFLSVSLNTPEIRFGYKGCGGNQVRLLRFAGLSDIANVESYGVPSIRHLERVLGPFLLPPRGVCPYHAHPLSKCALRAVRLVWYVLHHDRVLTSESQ